MAKNLKIPAFASEAEEAAWWPTQEDPIADEFEEAAAHGEVKHGSAVRRVELSKQILRCAQDDNSVG